MSIGNIIRAARKALGLSRKDAAALIKKSNGDSLSESYFIHLEGAGNNSSPSKVSAETIAGIEKALSCVIPAEVVQAHNVAAEQYKKAQMKKKGVVYTGSGKGKLSAATAPTAPKNVPNMPSMPSMQGLGGMKFFSFYREFTDLMCRYGLN